MKFLFDDMIFHTGGIWNFFYRHWLRFSQNIGNTNLADFIAGLLTIIICMAVKELNGSI